MSIEELLTKYTDLAHKREQAYEVFKSFGTKIDNLVYDNEVPVELKDVDGNPTGFTITIPDDLWKASAGMVIVVCGTEWMRCEDKWISCYGGVRNDTKMFIHILRNRDHVHLIHKGY